ncbi:MAG TPA: hypothetical protein VGM01_04295 [Ktedonobacteraceae bacterium]|jgi:F-type H+-transporting ATPase subunit beta
MNAPILPVGNAILGRVLNANGEQIDHKGSVENAMHLPLSTIGALAQTANAPIRLLETGIKAIDLMAPIAYGSVVGLIAGFGLGREVVVEEILHHLLTNRQGVAVIAGMRETTYVMPVAYMKWSAKSRPRIVWLCFSSKRRKS